MRIRMFGCGLISAGLLSAQGVRSGHVSAEWISESPTVQAGSVVRTAIRLTIDPEWHTYWVNPGESGVATAVEWTLPPGWAVSEISHPVPQRFLTGELVGFGHEGVVWFPVGITVPEEFTGQQELHAAVTWLSCNDDACVPGKAKITLSLAAGSPSPGHEAEAIARAFDRAPRPSGDGISLVVSAMGEDLRFQITGPLAFEPSATFVITPDVVDPKAQWEWQPVNRGWHATIPKSPYAPASIDQVELLLVPGAGSRPLIAAWKKSGRP